MMKEWIKTNLKKITLPRFGPRVEKDMEHESQDYTISDRCPRKSIHKVKKLVLKGNKVLKLRQESCSKLNS